MTQNKDIKSQSCSCKSYSSIIASRWSLMVKEPRKGLLFVQHRGSNKPCWLLVPSLSSHRRVKVPQCCDSIMHTPIMTTQWFCGCLPAVITAVIVGVHSQNDLWRHSIRHCRRIAGWQSTVDLSLRRSFSRQRRWVVIPHQCRAIEIEPHPLVWRRRRYSMHQSDDVNF